jgi:hypothetical protein
MKLIYSLIFLSLVSISSFSQDRKDLAKAYFKKAKKSYLEKDFEKTEKYLDKYVSYFGSIGSIEIAVFGAEFFFEKQKFTKAKEYLTAFFKLSKSKKSSNYNDMLLLYTDSLDAIENPIKLKKDTVIVSPKIITDETKIKGDSIKVVNNNKDVIIDEVDTIKGGGGLKRGNQSVPFSVIENVPVFPGCYGTRSELKDCFSKMIQMHFSTFFNSDLPNTLGLSKGKKRVLIGFTINTKGIVENILSKAPHPKLKEEVVRVMNLLPEMKPGTQRGKNVNVKYSLPFTLLVD